jgi:glucose-1-phosphate thymidylyltransferase
MVDKGIILAGGLGSRLAPITDAVSKQLLPLYDKPMIYYPLTTLMSARIRDICVIVNPDQESGFRKVLQDGSQWGINLTFLQQGSPEGLPQAYTLAEEFLAGKNSCLILGDNLLVGSGLGRNLSNLPSTSGASIFLYEVDDPKKYGNVELDKEQRIVKIVEKPEIPLSPYAIPGIYFLDGTASDRAKLLKKSKRNEFEMVDLLKSYLFENQLQHEILSRGTAWLDTGSPEDLYSASEFVRIIQKRQGHFIGCPEEVALRNQWITPDQLQRSRYFHINSEYGSYLRSLLEMSWD